MIINGRKYVYDCLKRRWVRLEDWRRENKRPLWSQGIRTSGNY